MKKLNKKKILILTATLFIYIPLVFAAISYSSSDVVVDNTGTSLGSIYLQDAIDEIDHACSVNAPKEYMCKNNTPKCVRATTLHTETCTNSDSSNYCQGDGYALNDTIIYGNSTTIPGVLTVGDAFDCDVNGDETFDAVTERFYYISDYFDTERQRFDDKIAVLVYYSNTDDGVASTTRCAYNCVNQNYNGPITAMNELPTTTQWNNIRLYKETRQILADNNSTSTTGGNLPSAFSYSGYAARLLTYQELYHGCYGFSLGISATNGLSTNCKFLFEMTKYAYSNYGTYGSWTETPVSNSLNNAYIWDAVSRNAYNRAANYTYNSGVRPVIEIYKSEIVY